MNKNQLLRQVAITSYSNAFLQGALELEEWYRHGIFHRARFHFRKIDTHGLVADDFTLWLEVLRKTGAIGISMQPFFSSFTNENPSSKINWAKYALVVQFGGKQQVWALGDELAHWNSSETRASLWGDKHFFVTPAIEYAGDIDTYWCVEEIEASAIVRATEWLSLAEIIKIDLKLDFQLSNIKRNFQQTYQVLHEDITSWANLPIFSNSKKLKVANILLTVLDQNRSQFANDCNPKNEGSPYQYLNMEEMNVYLFWGERLDIWFEEVLIRAANESYYLLLKRGQSEFKRITNAPLIGKNLIEISQKKLTDVRKIDVLVHVENRSEKPSKIFSFFCFIVGVIVFSIFIISIAKIISVWPLLGVLISIVIVIISTNRTV